MYRFRLHPTGTFVVMEDEILEDVDEAFAKSSEDFSERSIVDLTTMRVGRASTTMSLSVAPNPASTVITLVPIVPSHVMQPLRLDIIDVVGARVMSTTIPADATSTVNVSALPSGSYVVQIMSNDGLTARTMCRMMR
ncbi:MAG: T9SS C-terminal target domain-containing protein [Ignavibacteriae bacterium]|nr:MAG: T9SS C-terminal target domain-containing protein [Ignavibacteriota bacterium]